MTERHNLLQYRQMKSKQDKMCKLLLLKLTGEVASMLAGKDELLLLKLIGEVASTLVKINPKWDEHANEDGS